MDGATIASLAGTIAAIVVALLAFIRGRLTDARKADTVDFTAVTSGLQTLAMEQRIEIRALRDEVHACEQDKARMKGHFETEIHNLHGELADLRTELRLLGGAAGA